MSKASDKATLHSRLFIGELILLLIILPFLFFGEKHFSEMSGAIGEAAENVVAMPNATKIDSAFEGKIVYTQGLATSKDFITDPLFGIKVDALGLVRDVEYYQWKNSTEKKKVQQSDGTTKTESKSVAKKEWVDEPQASMGKNNTLILEVESGPIFVENAKLGAYSIGADLLIGLDESTPMQANLSQDQLERIHVGILAASEKSDAVSESIEEFYADTENGQEYLLAHVSGHKLFLGEEANDPDAGDIRIGFETIPKQEISVIAQVNGNALNVIKSSAGQELVLVSPGKVSLEEMLAEAESSNSIFQWLVRIACFIFLVIALRFMLAKFGDSLSSIPVVGSSNWLLATLLGALLTAIIIVIA